jgi:hypothetical protein
MSGFRAILIAIGAGVIVTSAALGGWQLWQHYGTSFPIVPVPANIKIEPAPQQVRTALDDERQPIAPTPVVVRPMPEPEPVKADELRKKEIKGKKHDDQNVMLSHMMSRFHSEAYMHFIRQPGFGQSRLGPTISVVQREWNNPEWTSEELAKEQAPIKGAKDLPGIHRLSLNFFAASNTKSNEERAKAEEESWKEKKEQLWEIKAMDLVGLVMHETPKVYVSTGVPDMKKLKTMPTRDVDIFESEGLEELMSGKDLYVRSKNETIRVLGPLRAQNACLKCHGDAKEGDMLGAFSYTLRVGQYRASRGGFAPDLDDQLRKLVPKITPE